MKRAFMKGQLVTVFLILIFLSTVACSHLYIAKYYPTHKGKVVDAETGEPIEGAVALGAWFEVNFVDFLKRGVASSSFYDAYETTTDKYGEFTIPGKGFMYKSNVDEMELTLVKAKYSHVQETRWSELKDASFVERNGRTLVFKLRKRSLKERKMSPPTSNRYIPDNFQVRLLKEINEERKEIGFSTYIVPGDDFYHIYKRKVRSVPPLPRAWRPK